MPTRAIKLKLVVPRKPRQLDSARNLWTTHAVINAAVNYYETHLLAMRGEAYLSPDDEEIARASVQGDLDQLIRNVPPQPVNATSNL